MKLSFPFQLIATLVSIRLVTSAVKEAEDGSG